MRERVVSALLLASALLAMPASAQRAVSAVDLRNFAPPTDPESSLYLEKPTTEGAGAYNVGVWFSYANRLLFLQSAAGARAHPLEHQYSIDYIGSLGITDWLSVGLGVPTIVHQEGNQQELLSADAPLPGTGLGDLRGDLKATLIQPGTVGTLALAALLRGTLPTASELVYAGHEKATAEARFLSELSYLSTKLQATAGVRLRRDVGVIDQRLGHDLPWAAAALWTGTGTANRMRWTLAAEVRGNIGLEPSFAEELASPVLGGLSVRWTYDDWSLLTGAETGLNQGLGGPRIRGVIAAGYAPRIKDADEDGIEDHLDECPLVAEDKDGFQDRDGCPDVDNDNDGVSDTDDQCPQELEDHDDFEDHDGCPDPDNDGDGIPDVTDACPLIAGEPSETPKYHGCRRVDSDADGIYDDKDRCPTRPEDQDGFEDEDGCPDPDNDRDAIEDHQDACPDQRGPRRSDPKLNGCPNPDRDGDTFEDGVDECPEKPETFNDVDDDDGCPDNAPEGQSTHLIEVVEGPQGPSIELVRPLEFVVSEAGVEVAPESLPLLRAIGARLNRHEKWVVLVGVRPTDKSFVAEQQALNKSFAVVFALSNLTHRDGVAESVSFQAVKDLKQAQQHGVGLMVLAPKSNAPAARQRD